MKKSIAVIMLMLFAFSSMQAQKAEKKALSNQEREQWLTEMRNFKREFLTRELELTPQQQQPFFSVYEQMDDELNRISAETRDLESKVSENANASNTEVEAAARALFEQKSREGKVEIEYFEQIKEILTPQQLIRLKNAERKFTQQLVRHRGKSR